MLRSEHIIDSDAHVFEPHDIWVRHLDAPLRKAVTTTPGLRTVTAPETMVLQVYFRWDLFLKLLARIFFSWLPILGLALR